MGASRRVLADAADDRLDALPAERATFGARMNAIFRPT